MAAYYRVHYVGANGRRSPIQVSGHILGAVDLHVLDATTTKR